MTKSSWASPPSPRLRVCIFTSLLSHSFHFFVPFAFLWLTLRQHYAVAADPAIRAGAVGLRDDEHKGQHHRLLDSRTRRFICYFIIIYCSNFIYHFLFFYHLSLTLFSSHVTRSHWCCRSSMASSKATTRMAPKCTTSRGCSL
jgi:hypothetical protein